MTGHWLAVVVTHDSGDLGGDNALAALPWSHPLTWLFQVMPVFFLVGGFVNGASLTSHRNRGGGTMGWLLGRTDRLLRPATVFLVVLAASAVLASVLGADPDLVSAAAWVASIPLWFLVVYIAVVVLAPWMHALHRHAGLAVPVVLTVAVGTGDVARLFLGMPSIGEANYILAWLAIHQVGFAWQDGRLPARRDVAWPLAAGGLVALVLLTVVGPYPVSMVSVPGEPAQNTAPPTLALLALATAQTGFALLLSGRSNRWLRRTRPWMVVVGVNAVILTVFLWHMAAVVVTVLALYPTGVLPAPPVGSAAWLLLRLPWLACLAVVLAVLVTVFGPVELRRGWRPEAGVAVHGAGPLSGIRARAILTLVGLVAVLAGLLGVTVAGPEHHGPAGLPTETLLAYLLGVAVLRLARWSFRGDESVPRT